jgi:hypothetical protein
MSFDPNAPPSNRRYDRSTGMMAPNSARRGAMPSTGNPQVSYSVSVVPPGGNPPPPGAAEVKSGSVAYAFAELAAGMKSLPPGGGVELALTYVSPQTAGAQQDWSTFRNSGRTRDAASVIKSTMLGGDSGGQ